MEVFYAWTLGKPIVLWVDKDLEENLSPWMRYHVTKIVNSFEDTVNTVCYYCETEVL
jgi:hypothetical protein